MPEQQEGARLFIGNLAPSTRREVLQDHFAKFGTVVSVDVLRGFGYVQFQDPKDAEDAREELNGSMVGADKITVEMARPRPAYGSRERGDRRDDRRRDDYRRDDRDRYDRNRRSPSPRDRRRDDRDNYRRDDRAPRRDYANDRRDAPPAPSRREHDDAPPPKRADSQSPRGASDNRRSSRSPRR